MLDGCGAGAAPDADIFGDVGEFRGDTLLNVWKATQFRAPNLGKTGFLAAAGIPSVPERCAYGRMREISLGKDTITGHWEMMGIHFSTPLPTYPKGFPIPLIKEFERRIARQTLGNCPASGTEIISRLGALHMETGFPIVYTSADSVFQIAAHETIVPIEELYGMCRIAREMLIAPNNVGRVIARPFLGNAKDGFVRTERRKDFPIDPPHNLADEIVNSCGPIFGIGVIPQIFNGRGFREVRRTQDNAEHGNMLFEALESDAKFIWANFEDFDMLFGHRNDVAGFAGALERFDVFLEQLLMKLRPEDLLILTADHGNDPTTQSTGHTREYVPFAMAAKSAASVVELGDLEGMWCLGATAADALGVPFAVGESQLSKLR